MAASFNTRPDVSNCVVLAVVLLSTLPTVQAAPINLPSWLQDMIPEKGGTIADEIKCYSLPYGTIGFVSHLLSYWTVVWLSAGRRPYMPWRRIRAGWFDLCLSLTQITITVGLAAFTIVRCRSRWQFILLAVWKLTMSATVGFWGIWASLRAIKNKGIVYTAAQKGGSFQESEDDGRPRAYSVRGYNSFTLLIYALAMAVGLVGVISLVAQNIHVPDVWKITVVFGSVVAFSGVVALVIGVSGTDSSWTGAVAASVFAVIPAWMLVLGAFYCDWILAALAGNLIGIPSGDTAVLYWIYFSAKRLPLMIT